MTEKHTCSLSEPIHYPGGKEGLVRSVCDQGDYASAASTPRRVMRAGKAHERAKNVEEAPLGEADLKAAIARHPANRGGRV